MMATITPVHADEVSEPTTAATEATPTETKPTTTEKKETTVIIDQLFQFFSATWQIPFI